MSNNPPAKKVDELNPDEMDLYGHLGELRQRLFLSFVAVAITSVITFIFSSQIFSILAEPYFAAFPDHDLIGTGPAEASSFPLLSQAASRQCRDGQLHHSQSGRANHAGPAGAAHG